MSPEPTPPPPEAGPRKSAFIFRLALWSVGLSMLWVYLTAFWYAMLASLAWHDPAPPDLMMRFLVLLPVLTPLVMGVAAGLRHRWRPMGTWAFMLGVALWAAPQMAPGPSRPEWNLQGCGANLRQVGAAAEVYASEHGGLYPPTLQHLVPTYLRDVPTCPEAGLDTYAWQVSPDGRSYTAWCSGTWHEPTWCPLDHPRMSSREGFQEGR